MTMAFAVLALVGAGASAARPAGAVPLYAGPEWPARRPRTQAEARRPAPQAP
jgi:hypothetical protein